MVVKNVKKIPAFLSQAIPALEQTLKDSGITAAVECEPVKGTKLYRLFVVARQFEQMRPSERQDLVWRIIDKALPTPEDQMKISMVLTLSEKEAGMEERISKKAR